MGNKRCFVPFCKTRYKHQMGDDEPKYSLFKAPNDDVMLEKWRERIPTNPFSERELSKEDRVCEKHFEPRFVVPRFQQTRHGGDFYTDHIRPKLAFGALPTLFPDKDPSGRPLRFKQRTAVDGMSNLNAKIALLLPSVKVAENESISVCYKCLIKKCSTHVMYFK